MWIFPWPDLGRESVGQGTWGGVGRNSWALLHQTLAEEFGIYPQSTGSCWWFLVGECHCQIWNQRQKGLVGETSDGKDQFVYVFNGKLKQNFLKKWNSKWRSVEQATSLFISKKMRTWFGTSRPIELKCFCIVSLNNQMMKSILQIVSRTAVQKALVSHWPYV